MKIISEPVVGSWRRWFAWRPVRTIHYEWVWLEVVERATENARIDNVVPSSWIIYRRIIE